MDLFIERIVFILSLELILPYNHIATVSADTSSGSSNESESNHRKTNNEQLEIKRENICWTPKLKSELLDSWVEADPKSKGHAQRLHHIWSQKREKYSHLKPKTLQEKALKFIKTWKGPFDEQHRIRLEILNASKQLRWTKELRENLMKCRTASSGCKEKFERLWAQHHPEYAHLNTKYLLNTAKHFEIQALQGGSRRKDPANLIWNEQLEAKLMEIWDKTYSSDRRSGQTEKIFREWKCLYPKACNFQPKYLKSYANSLIYRGTLTRIMQGENSEILRRRLKYMNRQNQRINWTPKMVYDLLKCWRKSHLSIEERSELWKESHRMYADIIPLHLAEMASYYEKILKSAPRKEIYSQQPNVVIGQDYNNASSLERPRLYQSTASRQTPYAPQIESFQHGGGEGSRKILPSEHASANQQFSYIPHLKDSQYEFGESSSVIPRLHQSIANQQTPYALQFEGSQHGYNESSSGTPRLHHFFVTDTRSNPIQPRGSHQSHAAIPSYRANLEPMKKKQRTPERQKDKRPISSRKQSQRLDSPKHKEDLDLDLHL